MKADSQASHWPETSSPSTPGSPGGWSHFLRGSEQLPEPALTLTRRISLLVGDLSPGLTSTGVNYSGRDFAGQRREHAVRRGNGHPANGLRLSPARWGEQIKFGTSRRTGQGGGSSSNIIQCRTTQGTRSQSRKKSGLIDQWPARGVDQERRCFHLPDLVCANDSTRLNRQREVQRQNVRSGQEGR